MTIIYQPNSDNNSQLAFIVLEQNYIDGYETKRFKEEVIEKLNKNVTALTIDMSNVTHISSTGLGMIVSAYVTLKRYDIKLNIANVSKEIRALFNMIKVDTLISVL